MCSYSRNRRRISSWGREQENQGSEIDAAYLSPGCSMGCSTWRQEASQHSPYRPRFTCKIAFFESRRADSNRLALLITSVRSVVAGRCRGMHRLCKSRISKPVSCLCLVACCTVLRPRWCKSGVNVTLIELRLRTRVLFHQAKPS
jgi:hypothetical protein